MTNDPIVQINSATSQHRATLLRTGRCVFMPAPAGAADGRAAVAPARARAGRGPTSGGPKTGGSRNSIVVEQVPIDLLRPDPANPRRIGDAELDALERSIREFGFVQPVLARRADGTVIGGHQRLVAARRLGLQSVPVSWLDLSIEQARVLGLALNRIGGYLGRGPPGPPAGRTRGRRRRSISPCPGSATTRSAICCAAWRSARSANGRRPSISTPPSRRRRGSPGPSPETSGAWESIGCSAATPRRLPISSACSPVSARRWPSPTRHTTSALGDHGGHQGRPAPPPHRQRQPRSGRLRSLRARLEPQPAGLRRRRHLRLPCRSKELPLLCRVLAEEGGHWSDTIIWAKDRFVLGRADYQRSYEPIWYGWREGLGPSLVRRSRPGRCLGDPATRRGPAAPDHEAPGSDGAGDLQQLPNRGDLVADLFAGSGSTLIAAERTGRRCAALELDPIYVDVIIARWESFSGEKAGRIDG